ncbi:hypothetical protein HanXRQr2_Chr05g0235691 [Helianthus annuus]|uniref:Uncharacterized protein n=1 Tax=Helianthus annuus TaxID=4232 RepID=A0A9K3NP88_HELAN|nr:hypothetical protein HanXRQr2_Chr05g0235691 [Helianthus annuus]
MTLAQFVVRCDLYLEPDIITDLYRQGLVVVDRPTFLGFWDVIVEPGTWDHILSKWKISAVYDPLYWYLHKFICTCITARGKSCEWCTTTDLFFFYYLLYRRPCALVQGLA